MIPQTERRRTRGKKVAYLQINICIFYFFTERKTMLRNRKNMSEQG